MDHQPREKLHQPKKMAQSQTAGQVWDQKDPSKSPLERRHILQPGCTQNTRWGKETQYLFYACLRKGQGGQTGSFIKPSKKREIPVEKSDLVFKANNEPHAEEKDKSGGATASNCARSKTPQLGQPRNKPLPKCKVSPYGRGTRKPTSQQTRKLNWAHLYVTIHQEGGGGGKPGARGNAHLQGHPKNMYGPQSPQGR